MNVLTKCSLKSFIIATLPMNENCMALAKVAWLQVSFLNMSYLGTIGKNNSTLTVPYLQ